MTAQVAPVPATVAALHQAVEQFSDLASEPLHLEELRERFNENALRSATDKKTDGGGVIMDNSNPLVIKEELQAQKDYFRRLKFTYLEQEAKSNFLSSIVGDSPQGVHHRENEELEEVNAGKKQALKELKENVYQMGDQAITMARENMARNIVIKKRLAEAQSLQKQIREAELELARIKAKHPVDNRLTTDQASEVLTTIDDEMNRVVKTTEVTKRDLAATSDAVKRTAKEVARLNNDRAREEARAKEVQEGREAGDTKVDDICRWLTASTEYYMTLMGIRSVQSSSEGNAQLLHLEYDIAGTAEPVILVLRFQTASKRLMGAQLLNSNIDISQQVDNAVRSNDVPGLVGDVLGLVRAPDA